MEIEIDRFEIARSQIAEVAFHDCIKALHSQSKVFAFVQSCASYVSRWLDQVKSLNEQRLLLHIACSMTV